MALGVVGSIPITHPKKQLFLEQKSSKISPVKMLPSSRGLGLRPFTAATGVRIPLGVQFLKREYKHFEIFPISLSMFFSFPIATSPLLVTPFLGINENYLLLSYGSDTQLAFVPFYNSMYLMYINL